MNRKQLFELIRQKRSFLCVGLDSDINKIPAHLLDSDDPVFEFNRQIIEATIKFAVAYKPNFAFYESRGSKGLQSLEKTMLFLKKYENEVFTIADAKRGDIGNTSAQYAKSVFDEPSSGFSFNAVTVAPYMGEDSVKPFLDFEGKWAIILALTSNKGSDDFQLFSDTDGKRLFERVLERSQQWGNTNNLMYVVGATKAEMLGDIRKIVPGHFLLVPGVGAQGGSLHEVAKYGLNDHCGLLVNASRSIIFASKGPDFAEKAKAEAAAMQEQMETLLRDAGLID
ncbi:MAG TPA: orotidine-5'-phosphate decarboxylase [Bacteroidales bacterium]|nr:orotidine-5'-phosphate decarboxylase [Bacteroidales bacterium]HPT01061.1 orotidine-5'-phosphate decarboxylase [Bacteroidales bacterium]